MIIVNALVALAVATTIAILSATHDPNKSDDNYFKNK